jgi:hypothetical protein
MEKGLGANGPLRVIVVVLIAVSSVAYSFYQRFCENNQQISILSHVFGSIAGFLVGLSVLKKVGKKTIYCKILLRSSGFTLYLMIAFVFVLLKIFQ